MGYVKLFEDFSKMDKWGEGIKNTKTFLFYTPNQKMYLQGCRTCNDVLPIENLYNQRQRLGNVYQTVCNCSVCGNYMVVDEHRLSERDSYLKNKEKMDSYHKSQIHNALHVNIYTEKLEGLEPDEIIGDNLYVYVKESHTNDLMDDPFNRYHIRREYYLIIDLDRKIVYCPYPESRIEKYPEEVQVVFKRYIAEYCR